MSEANSEVEGWFLDRILKKEIVFHSNDFFYRGTRIGSYNANGYIRRYIFPEGMGGKRYNIQEHRLLWMIVHKAPIPPLQQINHLNGLKSDNRIENFELVSNRQNVQHAFDTGLARRTETANVAAVRNNPRKVFTDEEVAHFRELFSSGSLTIDSLSERFNCSSRTVRDMLTGKTYRYIDDC